MKVFAATPTTLALLAVFPTMVQGRGAKSYHRRKQETGSKRSASPEAMEDKKRRQRNLKLIRDAAGQRHLFKGNLRKPGRTDVVIGGVGYAGAKLGEVLAETGSVDFVMLEASDRIGGRMSNVPFGAGDKKYSIELGAQWIDGIDGSPSWDLAVESGLLGSFDEFGFEVYDENGDRDLFEEYFEEGSECLAVDTANSISDSIAFGCLQVNEGDPIENQTLCDSIASSGSLFVPGNNDDISVEMTWDMAADFRIFDRDSPSSARNCQTFYEDFEQGLAPYEVSTNNSVPLKAYVDFGDGDYFVSDDRGFSWLPKYLCAKYLSTSVNTPEEIVFDDERLKLNHKIVVVKWDPEGEKDVIVVACLTERVDDNPNMPALFPCKPGRRNLFLIRANEFVSTFSVSVLRESVRLEKEGVSFRDSVDIAPRFKPALSETIEGIDIILGYRAGIYNKAFFQFSKKFWSNAAYMQSAYSEGPYVGDFAPTWSNRAREGLDPESNILHLYTFSDRAFELDQMSKDDVIEELLPVLNGMFDANITELYGGPLTKEDVLDFYLTRWSVDPLFYGGFDLEHINVPLSSRELFKKRYGNLVLSGVYSCDRHNGWTHGGLLAGERTGILLLKERYGYEDLDTTNICDNGTGQTSSPTSFPTSFDDIQGPTDGVVDDHTHAPVEADDGRYMLELVV